MFKNILVSATVVASASAGKVNILGDKSKSVEGSYIVKLDSSLDHTMLPNFVNKVEAALGNEVEVTNVFTAMATHGALMFAAKLTDRGLDMLSSFGNIEFIQRDEIVSIFDSCANQADPDWGLSRTSQRGSFDSSADYVYDSNAAGAGVDAYIIDTGIYCENVDFVNKQVGTCRWGYDAIDGTMQDGNGHGTHCAGTVGGITYGVAKEVDLIAVRVLNNAGSGSTRGIVDGINWMIANAASSGKPSVANLSLGGGYNAALNAATDSAVAADISMIVAAGNDNKDACNYSPASTASAVTVGATDSKDVRAYYSNYGTCVDIFGPGSSITSAWIGSPTATNTISGTSMATPHVCGVAAKYLSADPSLTVSGVSSKLVNDATKNVITNVGTGSPNLMVYAAC